MIELTASQLTTVAPVTSYRWGPMVRSRILAAALLSDSVVVPSSWRALGWGLRLDPAFVMDKSVEPPGFPQEHHAEHPNEDPVTAALAVSQVLEDRLYEQPDWSVERSCLMGVRGAFPMGQPEVEQLRRTHAERSRGGVMTAEEVQQLAAAGVLRWQALHMSANWDGFTNGVVSWMAADAVRAWTALGAVPYLPTHVTPTEPATHEALAHAAGLAMLSAVPEMADVPVDVILELRDGYAAELGRFRVAINAAVPQDLADDQIEDFSLQHWRSVVVPSLVQLDDAVQDSRIRSILGRQLAGDLSTQLGAVGGGAVALVAAPTLARIGGAAWAIASPLWRAIGTSWMQRRDLRRSPYFLVHRLLRSTEN